MRDEPPPITEPFITAAEFADAKRGLDATRRTTASATQRLPFTIVIDTREQTPLAFPANVPTIRGTLHTGDYSITGREDEFTIERKSLADAVNTVIHDRARFVRELERMRDFAFRRIIVTCPFARMLRGHYKHSRANPNSVIGLLRSLEVKYNVPVTFADDAEQAARHIVDWAKYYLRHATPMPSTGPVQTPSPLPPTREGATLSPIPPNYNQQMPISDNAPAENTAADCPALCSVGVSCSPRHDRS